MRTLQAAAVSSALVLLCACGNDHGHGSSHAAESDTAGSQVADAHAAESHAHETGEGGLELRLDGAEKWQMDEHTRTMYRAMAARVEGREPAELASQELGRQLDEDLDALVQGCTMTGDAHRELHKFLGAYIPAVQALAAQGGENAAREVQHLLELYPRYFE